MARQLERKIPKKKIVEIYLIKISVKEKNQKRLQMLGIIHLHQVVYARPKITLVLTNSSEAPISGDSLYTPIPDPKNLISM